MWAVAARGSRVVGLLLFWQIDGPVTRTNMIPFVTDPIMLGPDARGIQQRE